MLVAQIECLIQGGVEIRALFEVGIGLRTSWAPGQRENADGLESQLVKVAQGLVLRLHCTIGSIELLALTQLVVQPPEQVIFVETDLGEGLAVEIKTPVSNREHSVGIQFRTGVGPSSAGHYHLLVFSVTCRY